MADFTPEQKLVIESRDKNLMVSAAAGSGKTTVMIERIKQLIVNENVPIENFLVVTFTKASSLDMKLRLINKLSAEQPTPFLLEQINDINTADVSNLHSFCARLLKTYFYEAGLDPTFIVLGEQEADILKQRALNKLFDQEYDAKNQDFYNLVDILQKNRSDVSLRENILKLYEFFNVIFNKELWFSKCLDNLYNNNLAKNQACIIINSYVASRVKKLLESIGEYINQFNDLKLNDFISYLQDMQSILSQINIKNSYIKNAKILFSIANFGIPPKIDAVFAEHRNKLDVFRKYVNAEISNFKANYITDDEEQIKTELDGAKKIAETLFKATTEFEKIYSKLKKEKCGLDYNDLEQCTLKVLENKDILQTLKQKYRYVFVDEYQDINAVQEKIISLLSGDNNRFMVGDVKQSIYGFRLCDPEILLNTYKLYKQSANSQAIDLSKNFRSNSEILEFVNTVFNGRMTEEFGGIDYQNTAQLVPGTSFKEESPVTLCYINTEELSKTKKSSGLVETGDVYSVKNHKQSEELENLKNIAEAEYIATTILDLVANKQIYDAKIDKYRSIRFRDIAILLPARNSYLDALLEVLSAHSIATSTDVMVDVLKDKYVKCIYNYLKLIYNYKQDIELFSVLYSPLSDFDLNDISNLRVASQDCRFFYQCMANVSDIEQLDAKLAEKVTRFSEKLSLYKNMAGYKTVKQVALDIIAQFNIENIILTEADGLSRINLLNCFIDSLPESNIYEYFIDGELASISAQKNADTDAVQIVTIHKSKGLEYPVTFLANINRTFNMMSLRGDLIISKQYGFATDYYNSIERYKNNNVAKEAIKLTETRKTIEEQQRLLYVALTRAINKMYIVGAMDFNKIQPGFPERQNSFSNWFEDFVYKFINDIPYVGANIEIYDAISLINIKPTEKNTQIVFANASEELQLMLKESINNKYQYQDATKTPKKTSVTEIASGYNQSEETFLKANNNTKSSSILKGNAYHKLMQYINFDCDSVEKLNTELSKLENTGILTVEEISLIDKDSILKTMRNAEFINILKFGTVLREKEFFLNISEDDVVIVQGVVDLAVIKDNQAIIVDYKTGRFDTKDNLAKYAKQINLYATAIEKAYDVKVIKKAICAIENGEIYYL